MIGRALIWTGVTFLLIGLTLTYAPWLLSWFGRLPGDIRIERPGGSVFIPFTSMIIVSVLLSLIVNLLMRR